MPLEATAESVDEETGVGWEELMEEDDGLEIFLVHAVEETCMDTHLTLAIRPTIILWLTLKPLRLQNLRRDFKILPKKLLK